MPGPLVRTFKYVVISMICLHVLLLFPTRSEALFLIEPYAGYESGTQTANSKSGLTILSDTDLGARFSNNVVGARVGLHVLLVWLALDMSLGTSGHAKMNDSTLKELSYTRATTGLSAGVDLPFMFRIWGGITSERLLVSSSLARDDNSFVGNGLKAGLGFSPLPLVSINIEYITRNYTDYDGYIKKYHGYNFDKFFTDFKQGSTILSISLPLSL